MLQEQEIVEVGGETGKPWKEKKVGVQSVGGEL